MRPTRILQEFHRHIHYRLNSRGHRVRVFNMDWGGTPITRNWFYRFILERNILPETSGKRINLFSVNGLKFGSKLLPRGINVFLTNENVNVTLSPWWQYRELFLQDESIKLSIGFDYLDDDRYLRFPLWLTYLFDPADDDDMIRQRCRMLSTPGYDYAARRKFCSMLVRVDYFGDRKIIYDEISTLGRVDCDSNFLHNNDELKELYGDDKFSYLQNYRFNLCPENSNSRGYVTEKIFEAIHSGCIPIYWGAENDPEPGILNKSAILFVDNSGYNPETMTSIQKMIISPEQYLEFASQPRLLHSADEHIIRMYHALHRKLTELVRS